MSLRSTVEASSVQGDLLAERELVYPLPIPSKSGPVGLLRRIGRGISALAGWCWRILVGAFFCFSAFVLSYFTSILVVGWSYRWMQGLVLHGWWKRSRFRGEGSFEDFCARFGPDAPVTRPRWFWQERIRAHLTQPAPDGSRPSGIRICLRCLLVPWHSLWRNLKTGIQGLFCTYLLTGWGCLFMVFSWEFGWLNSFHKGYELALVGPLTGILGILLFIAAMCYVPMAQVHQAVTGDYRAFFDFRFVWRLIRARLTAYVGLAALIALVSLPLEMLKTAPSFFSQMNPSLEQVSDKEMFDFLQNYLHGCAFALFLALLLTRFAAALVYRSAVLKVLAEGQVSIDRLHPVLTHWLECLEVQVQPPATRGTVLRAIGATTRPPYRGVLYTALFAIWFAFIAKVYVGEFLNYHPGVGFGNHPSIQLPCFDYMPSDLQSAANP